MKNMYQTILSSSSVPILFTVFLPEQVDTLVNSTPLLLDSVTTYFSKSSNIITAAAAAGKDLNSWIQSTISRTYSPSIIMTSKTPTTVQFFNDWRTLYTTTNFGLDLDVWYSIVCCIYQASNLMNLQVIAQHPFQN